MPDPSSDPPRSQPARSNPAGSEATKLARVAGLQIEYAWIDPPQSAIPATPRHNTTRNSTQTPLLVFLHEGLGSLAMWKDFPAQLCSAIGARGLVYSRPGYGRSTARGANEHWGTDFMHRQAIDILPGLLRAVLPAPPQQPVWLFGHSDGASIALIHAARFPEQVAGVISVAAHVFVENLSLRSIETARQAYVEQGLRARLARWHDDVDSAFWGWCNAWLSPAFRAWTLHAELRDIRCPVLVIQGEDDEYGTMDQISAIETSVADTERLALARCGHSPHRDQPQAVIDAVKRFMTKRAAGPDRTHPLETS